MRHRLENEGLGDASARSVDAAMLDRRLAIAMEIAEEAGHLALRLREQGLAPATAKGRHDVVTLADVEVETLIRDRLRGAFPEDGVLGEEGGGTATRSLWVVDPIDGTTNFAHGGDDWCVSIAHMSGGQAQIGVVYVPVTRRMHAARLGGGARCDGAVLSLAREVPADRALVEIDWGVDLGAAALRVLVDGVLEAGCEFRRSGSCALGLANVAAGRVDGYVEAFTRPWDGLAGCVLVREAGGRTSAFEAGLFEAMGNPIAAGVPGLVPTLSRVATEAMRASQARSGGTRSAP